MKMEEEIKLILDGLKDSYFDELGSDYDFEMDVYLPFVDNYKGKHTVKMKTGATKGILLFSDLDFVIKIPFSFCEGEELQGATETEGGWNYCEQENCRYIMSENEQVSEIFLNTELIGYVNDFPIYAQYKATPISLIDDSDYVKHHRSHSNKNEKKVFKIRTNNAFENINLQWEADIYSYYGKNFYCRLMEFLQNYEIDDLREPNIGYINKRPVIFDYAGFDY